MTRRYGPPGARVDALRGIDLVIRGGEYLALAGRSGAGKSTLLSVLGCLETPTSGSYRIDGTEVGSLSDVELSRLRARRFGFVFQAFHLVPELTALDNVMLPMRYGPYPRRAWRERAILLLERIGIRELASRHPPDMSSGQQQRVAIARALANDPDVILADEPSGNLDTATRDQIVDVLEELWRQGKTLVIASHDPGLAARAPRRVLLEDGRIAADAPGQPR